MRAKLLKKKSHMEWSWVLMVIFFALGIYNVIFGILGFLCMITPMVYAMKGEGKIHCSHYCPRGSLLGKFLEKISANRPLPSAIRTKWFKNLLLGMMITMLTIALIHADGDINKIGFALLRFMTLSFAAGIAMGVFFKPRSWCQVCPMAHATGIIENVKKGSDK